MKDLSNGVQRLARRRHDDAHPERTIALRRAVLAALELPVLPSFAAAAKGLEQETTKETSVKEADIYELRELQDKLRETIANETQERKAAMEALTNTVHQFKNALMEQLQEKTDEKDADRRRLKDALDDLKLDKENMAKKMQDADQKMQDMSKKMDERVTLMEQLLRETFDQKAMDERVTFMEQLLRESLDQKANMGFVEEQLSAMKYHMTEKADTDYVEEQMSLLHDQSEIEIAKKASGSYVDVELEKLSEELSDLQTKIEWLGRHCGLEAKWD